MGETERNNNDFFVFACFSLALGPECHAQTVHATHHLWINLLQMIVFLFSKNQLMFLLFLPFWLFCLSFRKTNHEFNPPIHQCFFSMVLRNICGAWNQRILQNVLINLKEKDNFRFHHFGCFHFSRSVFVPKKVDQPKHKLHLPTQVDKVAMTLWPKGRPVKQLLFHLKNRFHVAWFSAFTGQRVVSWGIRDPRSEMWWRVVPMRMEDLQVIIPDFHWFRFLWGW